MIYVMAIKGRTSFPYTINDRRMVDAFARLSKDLDVLFRPYGVRNQCRILAHPIHGTSSEVEKMLIFASFHVGLLRFSIPGNGTLFINCSAEHGEAAFRRPNNLPGDRAVYEEIVERFRKYYEESPVREEHFRFPTKTR